MGLEDWGGRDRYGVCGLEGCLPLRNGPCALLAGSSARTDPGQLPGPSCSFRSSGVSLLQATAGTHALFPFLSSRARCSDHFCRLSAVLTCPVEHILVCVGGCGCGWHGGCGGIGQGSLPPCGTHLSLHHWLKRLSIPSSYTSISQICVTPPSTPCICRFSILGFNQP